MKHTLLEIVQAVLTLLRSDNVSALSDTVEAYDVATIVRMTYYNLFPNRLVPEHNTLLTLDSASDTDFPTHFTIPEGIKFVAGIWYSSTNSPIDYYSVKQVTPEHFIRMADGASQNYDDVTVNGTNLRIRNDRNPTYWTTFDDDTIIMDSYDSTIEDTLQESKIRAYGTEIPTFTIEDSFTPDIDENQFNLLVLESASLANAILKQSVNPKLEQMSTRQRRYLTNDKHKVPASNGIQNYGRTPRK